MTGSERSPTSTPRVPCVSSRPTRGAALARPFHHGFRPTVLAWSSDGRRLLAMNPVRLVVLDASLRQIGAHDAHREADRPFTTAAFAPRGHAVVLLRRSHSSGRTRLDLLAPGRRCAAARDPRRRRCTASRRRPTAARCWSAGVQPTSGCSCRRRAVRARARHGSRGDLRVGGGPRRRRLALVALGLSVRLRPARSPRARARSGAG